MIKIKGINSHWEKCNWDYKRRKLLVYSACFACYFLTLSMLKRSRLIFFALQLNCAVFSPLSLSDLRGVNLSTKTYSFVDVAPVNWESLGQHLLWDMCFVTYSN
jgi:hypothetical protein